MLLTLLNLGVQNIRLGPNLPGGYQDVTQLQLRLLADTGNIALSNVEL